MKTQLQLDSELLEGPRGGALPSSGDLDGAEAAEAAGRFWRGGDGIGGDFDQEGDFDKRCVQAFFSSKRKTAALTLEEERLGRGNERGMQQTQGPDPVSGPGNGQESSGMEDGGGGVGGGGEGESDESVLERLNAGEQRAMGELWGRYAGLLFSQALRVLHNPAEAEDVVVEVFSEVWRRAGGYHPERARPAAWLVTLVRRRAIDRFRERRSHERAEERLAVERAGGRDSCNGIEEQVRLSELRRLLEHALTRLPERQREAVCMVYFEGLTQREISKRTRTPIGTVKTRLELGLRKMRERIRGVRMRPQMDCLAGEECFSSGTDA